MDERIYIVKKMLFDLEDRFKSNLNNILKKEGLQEFLKYGSKPLSKINHKKYLLLMDFYLKQNCRNRFGKIQTTQFIDYCTPQQRLYGEQNNVRVN